MSKKRNKPRIRLLKSYSVLVGLKSALDYSEVQPESWQSKGKKPKPKVK